MAQTIHIQIETGNAAFEDAAGDEVARILRDLARHYEEVGVYRFRKIYDVNGNAVGSVELRDE